MKIIKGTLPESKKIKVEKMFLVAENRTVYFVKRCHICNSVDSNYYYPNYFINSEGKKVLKAVCGSCMNDLEGTN